ncbi:MAG TPA: universal stress protein [Nitrospiraceae bacterium]|nr:universal stress protein [Nitrospiraceae bacterium]
MRIILAVDGSDQSHAATQALAHLSRAEEVAVVHVLDVPMPAFPMMVPEASQALYQAVQKTMQEEGERILATATASLPMNVGPSQTKLETGKPADVILALAAETHADLIVLGSRGLNPMKELLLGSVSHRIVAHAPCSVLVVNRPLRTCDQVLLAIEGKWDGEAAIRWLKAKPFRAMPEISALTVLPFSPPPWPAGAAVSKAMEQEVVERASWFLEDLVKQLVAMGYRAKPLVVVGSPAVAITEQIQKAKPDLLLIGCRQREGLTRFVLGSVSHTLLHRAPCPVLLFH